MNGNLWMVMFSGGHYWAMPNYAAGRLQDWSLVQYQNGTLMPNPVKVPSNSITFIKTAVQLPPLAGPQPRSFQIGL